MVLGLLLLSGLIVYPPQVLNTWSLAAVVAAEWTWAAVAVLAVMSQAHFQLPLQPRML
jgi:hypothetical protein